MSAVRSSHPLPPFQAWASALGSDDVDEVRALLGDTGAPAPSFVVHGKGPVGYRQYRASGSEVSIGQSTMALPWTVRGQLGGLALHILMPPGSDYRLGRRGATTTRRSVVLLPPGLELTTYRPPGECLGLRVAEPALQRELAARRVPGDDAPAMPFAVIELADSGRSILLRHVAELRLALTCPADGRVLAMAQARVVSWLADLVSRQDVDHRAGPLAAARLAMLEDWIDAHLAEPLTLGRLCEQAGVGARSLQLAFEARRQMSPMRYVAERRLAAAHTRLSKPCPADTVTSIALDCGFDHMSRFAQAYRGLFGELPSHTLARGLSSPRVVASLLG